MSEKIKTKITTVMFHFLQTYLSSISYSIVKINERIIFKIGTKQYVCAILNTIICIFFIVHCYSSYMEYISEYKFKYTSVIRLVAQLILLHPFIIIIINFIAFFIQKETLFCILGKLSTIKQKFLITYNQKYDGKYIIFNLLTYIGVPMILLTMLNFFIHYKRVTKYYMLTVFYYYITKVMCLFNIIVIFHELKHYYIILNNYMMMGNMQCSDITILLKFYFELNTTGRCCDSFFAVILLQSLMLSFENMCINAFFIVSILKDNNYLSSDEVVSFILWLYVEFLQVFIIFYYIYCTEIQVRNIIISIYSIN